VTDIFWFEDPKFNRLVNGSHLILLDPGKFNMEPSHGCLEDDFPFQLDDFPHDF